MKLSTELKFSTCFLSFFLSIITTIGGFNNETWTDKIRKYSGCIYMWYCKETWLSQCTLKSYHIWSYHDSFEGILIHFRFVIKKSFKLKTLERENSLKKRLFLMFCIFYYYDTVLCVNYYFYIDIKQPLNLYFFKHFFFFHVTSVVSKYPIHFFVWIYFPLSFFLDC